MDVSGSRGRSPAIRFTVHAGRSDLLPPPDLPPSQVWRGLANQVLAHGYALGERWWMQWPGIGTFVLTAAAAEAVVLPEPGLDRQSLEDAMRRGATPVALLQREHEVLHASAVCHARGVVAFCAASGTGKSTLAAAVSGPTREFWADDFVVWRAGAGVVESSWFPSAGRLDAAAAAAVGLSEPTCPATPHPDTAPLAALVILTRNERVPPGAAVISRVQAERAFTAILPHAHDCRIGGTARVRRSLERYLELCNLVPVFELSFKPDLARVSDVAGHVVTWMDSLAAGRSQ